MDKQPANGILEDFRIDFLDCWQRLPNKAFFFILLVAWLALFQFLGNSTEGYIPTSSLLKWMYIVYLPSGDEGGADDSHGRFIPFVVLALFWWKRKQLFAHKLDLWWPGLLLVGLALGLVSRSFPRSAIVVDRCRSRARVLQGQGASVFAQYVRELASETT